MTKSNCACKNMVFDALFPFFHLFLLAKELNMSPTNNCLEIIICSWSCSRSKGTGKRGHIVADTEVSPFAAREPFVAEFCVRDTKNVSDFVQKHFVSATNVPNLHSPRNIMSNNMSATMCPRLLVP